MTSMGDRVTIHHMGIFVDPVERVSGGQWVEASIEAPGTFECELVKGNDIATVVKLDDGRVVSIMNARVLSVVFHEDEDDDE